MNISRGQMLRQLPTRHQQAHPRPAFPESGVPGAKYRPVSVMT